MPVHYIYKRDETTYVGTFHQLDQRSSPRGGGKFLSRAYDLSIHLAPCEKEFGRRKTVIISTSDP